MPKTGARRGEGSIQVGDREYQIFFNNRALAEAERVLGKSMGVLASQISTGLMSVGEVADLLRIGVNAARREFRLRVSPMNRDDALAIMDEIGFVPASQAVIEPLTEVLMYDPSEADDYLEDDNPPA